MAKDDLTGFTAAVTADRRRDEQAVLLRRLGLEVLTFPLLQTGPEDQANLGSLTRELAAHPPDVLLANTGYGMKTWLSFAAQQGLLEDLVASLAGHTTLAARGSKALGELRRAGLDAGYRAPSETLDELVRWAISQDIAGKHVVLQLHGEAPGDVLVQLEAAGATVTCVPVYKMGGTAETVGLSLVQNILDGAVDVVIFTAAPQLEALAAIAAHRSLARPLADCFNRGAVLAACIGTVCASAAVALGIDKPLVPEHPRLGSLAASVGAALSLRQLHLEGARGEVALSGACATAAGSGQMLSPSQRRALRPLSASPGKWATLVGLLPDDELTGLSDALDGALEIDAPQARLRLAGNP